MLVNNRIQSLGKGQEELTFLVTSEHDANHPSSCLQELLSFTEIPSKSPQEFRAQRKCKTRLLGKKIIIKSS